RHMVWHESLSPRPFGDPVTIEFQVFCYDSVKLDAKHWPAANRVATGLPSVKPRRQVESVAADRVTVPGSLAPSRRGTRSLAARSVRHRYRATSRSGLSVSEPSRVR